jgi:hypothetical protein
LYAGERESQRGLAVSIIIVIIDMMIVVIGGGVCSGYGYCARKIISQSCE